MDRLGADFQAFTDRENLVLSLTTEASLIEDSQRFMLEIISSRELTPKSVDSEKKIIINEIHQTYDDPEEWLWDRAILDLSDDTWALPVLGYKRSVKNITLESICSFYQRFLKAPKMLLISGNMTTDRLLPEWSELYVPNETEAKSRFLQFSTASRNVRFRRPTNQVYILGFLPLDNTLDLSTLFAIHVLMYLWCGANSSRLFQKAREELGLCYSIQSGFQLALRQGLCYLQASSRPKHCEKLIRLVEKDWKRLWSDLSALEWDFYRRSYSVQLQLQLEKLDARSEFLYLIQKFNEFCSIDDIFQILDRMSWDTVNSDLESILADKVFHWYCLTSE